MTNAKTSFYFKRNQCPIVHHSFNKWDQSILINTKCLKCQTPLCYYSDTGKVKPDKIILCEICNI